GIHRSRKAAARRVRGPCHAYRRPRARLSARAREGRARSRERREARRPDHRDQRIPRRDAEGRSRRDRQAGNDHRSAWDSQRDRPRARQQDEDGQVQVAALRTAAAAEQFAMIAGHRHQAGLTLALLLAALPASHAQAEKADRDKPINYQADSGDVNYQTKVGTLLGSVIITQGTLTIHADKVILRQNPDNSLSATAFGNPITFREKRDGTDEYYEGVAQRAEYDGQKRFLALFDRALLRQGTDEIRSNYIPYKAGTEFFKAEGRPDTRPAGAGEPPLGARVRGIFQPQPKDDASAGSAQGKAKGAKDDASTSSGQAKAVKDN